MVGHVAMEEVVIVPANHPRVRTDPAEGALDVFRSDGVEGAPNVQKRSKAVGAGVDVSFDIIRKCRSGGLRGLVTSKAVLLRMERREADTLLHVPGAEPLESFEEVVGK